MKRFDGYQHLVVMLFGILKHFDSLRELEIGMKSEAHKLMYYIDFISFMENPDRTWDNILAKQTRKGPPQPTLFD